MRPHVGETISAYAARLREKAKECEFGDTFDERILEHIIQTIDNKKLIERAISKTWDLTRFLTEASQTEDFARQIQDMGTEQVDHAGRVQSVPAISGFHHQMNPWKCGFCGLSRASHLVFSSSSAVKAQICRGTTRETGTKYDQS